MFRRLCCCGESCLATQPLCRFVQTVVWKWVATTALSRCILTKCSCSDFPLPPYRPGWGLELHRSLNPLTIRLMLSKPQMSIAAFPRETCRRGQGSRGLLYVNCGAWFTVTTERLLCLPARQEAAALAGPLSSVIEHSKEPSEPKSMSASTPMVSVAASPALDGSLRSLNVGKWGAEKASCIAVPAPDTPPPGIPQLPQASLTEGKPPRRSVSSRRRSLPRLPSLAEEEMTSPRRRQSLACTIASAQCSIPAMPRRHSSVCTAETALHDKKLAHYVPDAPHASPPQAELAERPLGRSLKRPPAQQLSDEDSLMRSAIKGFGKAASADDHRRRRALKSALVGSSSVSRARPSARSDCNPAVGEGYGAPLFCTLLCAGCSGTGPKMNVRVCQV